MKQATNTILMIRPVQFRYNEQTANNNYFQHTIEDQEVETSQSKALKEFDDMVAALRVHKVNVVVIEDTRESDTPDSVFPNNWVSFHEDGRVGLYPMYAVNRRVERRQDILDTLKYKYGFKISDVLNFSGYEEEDKFLESTGSMILDRPNKIAYAALSMRTNEDVLKEFCHQFNYEPVAFHANQTITGLRLPIYHTNVMMCVADQFAVICLDSIDNEEERQRVVESLENSGKEIIEITEQQEHQFAGNMLQVLSETGDPYLVMSTAAYDSLREGQRQRITGYCPIIHSPLYTIEELGGGSARCMMAEVFLPLNNNGNHE
ncbi:amidinotransferase [Fulvivirga sp. M361]|uniref:citrulline utilization hydrolase CtlX n=1 Tax=Fulvivirga sp. M361 TaxID=2594266 RepID=UPI00117B74F7|nr:arginine deiminase-related protein [Fulvivirga sp. M361]TRX47138.1 amidinotransferase [Fulvivirga sp. M361]